MSDRGRPGGVPRAGQEHGPRTRQAALQGADEAESRAGWVTLVLELVDKRERGWMEERRFLGRLDAGPEKFVNLQGLLVQSSSLFGINLVQFNSQGTSLSGKFVQFISGHRGQMPPFRSVQFISLSS